MFDTVPDTVYRAGGGGATSGCGRGRRGAGRASRAAAGVGSDAGSVRGGRRRGRDRGRHRGRRHRGGRGRPGARARGLDAVGTGARRRAAGRERGHAHGQGGDHAERTRALHDPAPAPHLVGAGGDGGALALARDRGRRVAELGSCPTRSPVALRRSLASSTRIALRRAARPRLACCFTDPTEHPSTFATSASGRSARNRSTITSRWRRERPSSARWRSTRWPVGTGRGHGAAFGVGVGVDPLPAAPGVDGEVPGDPHDPGLGVAPDLAPAHERARQSLLGDVLGLAAASEQLVRHPVAREVEVLEGLLEHEVDGGGVEGRGDRNRPPARPPARPPTRPSCRIARPWVDEPRASLPREEYARG